MTATDTKDLPEPRKAPHHFDPHAGDPHVGDSHVVDRNVVDRNVVDPVDVEVLIGRFLADRPVLPRAAFELVGEATQLLRNARAQAAALLTQARAEAEALRTEARQFRQSEARRGFSEGVEQGRRDQAHAIAQAGARQARALPDMNERIGLLVMRTLNKILTEQNNDERFFIAVVDRVLRAAREEKFLRMRVAASQWAAAQAAVDKVIRDSGAPNLIEVIADDGLRSGACLVESPHGVIDASLDTQLESIRQALTNVWQSPGALDR